MTAADHNRMKLLSRIIWIFFAILTAVVFVYSIPLRYSQLLNDPFELEEGLQALGLSLQGFAIYANVLDLLLAMTWFTIGCLLFWRKADDKMVYLISLTMILSPITILPIITAFQEISPVWALLLRVLRSAGLFVIGASFITFPDGEYVPGWTRWGLLTWLIYCALIPVFPSIEPITSYVDLREKPNLMRALPLFIILAFVVLAQRNRYRHHSKASQRQQTKWVVAGMLVSLVTTAALTIPPLVWASLQTSTTLFTLYLIAAIPLTLGVFSMFPLSITVAVLRYRLWDIDFLIRRTLIYSILTLLLAVIYLSFVGVLQGLFRSLSGGQSPVAIVVSTLTMVVLINPLRSRVQVFIDRRFYRRKYNSQQIVERFTASLRDEVDSERIAARLLSTAQTIIQPESISFWVLSANQGPTNRTDSMYSKMEKPKFT